MLRIMIMQKRGGGVWGVYFGLFIGFVYLWA